MSVAFACDKSETKSIKTDRPPDMEQPAPSSASPATAPASAPATQASAKAINQFCAVETKNKVDPKVTTVYNGKVIAFCCEDCIPDFKKDPSKYMASLK